MHHHPRALRQGARVRMTLRITGGAWSMAIAGTTWSIAVTVGWITVAVGWIAIPVSRITVAISVIRIRVIGACKGASDNRAKGEAAERRTPPAAPPAGISRGERGNRRNRDSGRRDESGQRFPHGVTSMSVERTMI